MIRLFLNTETERRQSFWTFALVGIVSLCCVQALYYLPVLWLALLMCVQVMTVKVVTSSLLGLLMPYWFALAYVAYTGNYEIVPEHFSALADVGGVFDFSAVGMWQWLLLALLLAVSVVAIVYYYQHNYYERHLYRMVFNAYSLLISFSLLLFILMPRLYWLCVGVVFVNTTPFVTRYFHKRWIS